MVRVVNYDMAPRFHLKALLFLPLLSASALSEAPPPIIDDAALIRSFQEGIGAFAGQDGLPTADDLAKSAGKSAPATTGIDLPEVAPAQPDYENLSRSVFMVGTVYKCDKCEHWHAGGVATAWCLSEDGLMVTNAHVVERAKGAAMGICDREGKCHPVSEVVAVDHDADIALIRVKGHGFRPLAIGDTAGIGAKVRVISHPDRRYFMNTAGEVSRYHRQAGQKGRGPAVWMSITADYAKGSSGGPVFNDKGEVVGMVSSTNSIYYESKDGSPKGSLQMVVKNCVPVSAIRALLDGK